MVNSSSIVLSNVSNMPLFIDCSLKIFSISKDNLDQIHKYCIITSFINCISAMVSSIGNGLVVAAVLKTHSLYSPSNLLLCGLASSDLLTGTLSQPIYITYSLATSQNAQIYCIASTAAYLVGYFLSGFSFLVLTLINLDRLLALQLSLRYNELVTNKRVMLTLLLCSSFAGTILLLPVTGENNTFRTLVSIVISVSVAANAFACLGIFRIVRKHQARIATEKQLSIRFCHRNIEKSFKNQEKTSRTTMCISALYFICYAPYLGVSFVLAIRGESNLSVGVRIAWNIAATIVFLNSSLNPILYCYRMREIRRAVHKVLKSMPCKPFDQAEVVSIHKMRNSVRETRTSNRS